jgi:hypothetical protein
VKWKGKRAAVQMHFSHSALTSSAPREKKSNSAICARTSLGWKIKNTLRKTRSHTRKSRFRSTFLAAKKTAVAKEKIRYLQAAHATFVQAIALRVHKTINI